MDAGAETDPLVPRFAGDSMIRRVHAEGVLLLGGGRALLMQIAHPAVARGVAEHSSFQGDRLGRLLRTLRPTLAIVFGSHAQAAEAARAIRRTHARVAGEGYAASDPALLLWVWATLVDTALLMHSLFVRPLRQDEAEAYLADMRAVGRALGIPSAHLPADLASFRAYVDATLTELTVGAQARAIARAIFDPGPILGPAMWGLRLLTAALLPAKMRAGFGLGEARLASRALRYAAPAARRLLPIVPRPLRAPPWFLLPPRAV